MKKSSVMATQIAKYKIKCGGAYDAPGCSFLQRNFDKQIWEFPSVGAAIHCANRWVGWGSRCHERRWGNVALLPIFGCNELLPLPSPRYCADAPIIHPGGGAMGRRIVANALSHCPQDAMNRFLHGLQVQDYLLDVRGGVRTATGIRIVLHRASR